MTVAAILARLVQRTRRHPAATIDAAVPFNVALMRITRRGKADDDRGAPVALVLPGAGYTVQGPLLAWPIHHLIGTGWDVWTVDWHTEATGLMAAEHAAFVVDAIPRVLAALPGPPLVVVAKSLGTHALPVFIDRDVCGVWLTPIVTDPTLAAAARATSVDHLLVGGTADPSWSAEAVHGTRARVTVLPDGNHSLETVGPRWRESAARQLEVLDVVGEHLDGRRTSRRRREISAAI
jgi:hypothetical protein